VSVNRVSWPPSIAKSLALHKCSSNNYQNLRSLLPSSTAYTSSYSCVRRPQGWIYKTNVRLIANFPVQIESVFENVALKQISLRTLRFASFSVGQTTLRKSNNYAA
jgi:hypothetical protein